MKNLLLPIVVMCLSMQATAQWVTISDPAFVTKLNQLFPGCMNGNQMNTQCPDVLSTIVLELGNAGISNLTGIEHFVGLLSLNCSNNQLVTLPPLPASLQWLDCTNNDLVVLPDLPTGFLELRCGGNNLTALPELPGSIIQILCDNNDLTVLPELPASLWYFNCSNNHLTTMPELPGSLYTLACGFNDLIMLPELPGTLFLLWCQDNDLIALPELPGSLLQLACQNNQIVCLPILPMSLTNSVLSHFHIANNPFTCMPNYVPAMSGPINGQWLNYPLCEVDDPVNNPFDCSGSVIPTTIDEHLEVGLQVFPNPGNGVYQVMLNSTSAGPTLFEVYDLAGMRVAEQRAEGALTVLDLSGHSAGLYVLRVWNARGSDVVKLVKQ